MASSRTVVSALASAVSVVLLGVSLVIVVVYNRFFSIDRLWGGSA